MTVRLDVIVMRIPTKSGASVWVEIDAVNGRFDLPKMIAEVEPLLEENGARTSQQFAPLFRKPLKENGAGAPLLHSAPLPSHEWRNTSPSGVFSGSKKSPQEELDEARQALAWKSSEMADLDSILAPVRAEERDIRDAILATHGRDQSGVVVVDFGNRLERRRLFEKLDLIAKQWGKEKALRKDLHSQIKTLEKQIEHIEREISKPKRKKA